MTKRQTQQAKNQEKSKSNQRLENNQRLAYPRLRREAQHKSLGGSPEKQPKNQDAIILTIILLLYPNTLVNPQFHVRYKDEGLTRVR